MKRFYKHLNNLFYFIVLFAMPLGAARGAEISPLINFLAVSMQVEFINIGYRYKRGI